MIKRITTESGAVYTLDVEANTLSREGPKSRGIDYQEVPDSNPDYLTYLSDLKVGEPLHAAFTRGRWRLTTPVVSIETLEED